MPANSKPALSPSNAGLEHVVFYPGGAAPNAKSLDVRIPQYSTARDELIHGFFRNLRFHIPKYDGAVCADCQSSWQPIGNRQSEYERCEPMSREQSTQEKEGQRYPVRGGEIGYPQTHNLKVIG